MQTLDHDGDTYLYYAILKTYRNAVAAFIRSRLKAAFGDTWEQQIRRLFAKEWDDLERVAEARRSDGTTALPLGDAADLLSVNHFFTIFEKHFTTLWPDLQGQKALRSNLLLWARTVKQYRDPVAHPQEQPLPVSDALVALDAAYRVLLRVDQVAAESVHAIWERVRTDSASAQLDPLPHNLPPRETIVVDFVGRTQVLEQLYRWIADEQSRLWVLQGDGGKGKTSIAYAFADDLARRGHPTLSGIVWLSAKKRRFLEGTVRALNPGVVDLSTAIDATLSLFGPVPSGSMSERRQLCLELLEEIPVLIVVDDVDSLEGEQEDAVAFFLQEVSQTRSKVLFTTRRKLFGLGSSSTVVAGLDLTSALEFLDSRLRVFDLDPSRYTQDAKEKIANVTDGSPLYMEDLLRLTHHLSPSEAIRYWQGNQGARVREYAMQREVEALTSLARKVLVACALSEGPVTLDELQVVARLGEEEVYDAMGELGRIFLLPQLGPDDGVTRYSLNRNTSELVRHLYAHEKIGREIQAALRSLGSERSDPPELSAACRKAHILAATGREFEAERELLNLLDEKYPEHPTVYGQLGRLYSHWSPVRLADARKSFRRAYEMKSRAANTYQQWAILELEQGKLEGALEVCVLGLERCGEDVSLLRLAGSTVSRMADALRRTVNFDRAEAEGRRALEYLERARTRSHVVDVEYRELSRLYGSLWRNANIYGDAATASVYLSEWGRRLPYDSYYQVAQESAKSAPH